MPFAPHLRVTASGTLGGAATTGLGAVERFSYGFSISGTTFHVPSASNNADAMNDIAADVRAFHGRAGSNIGNLAIIDEVKIAAIGADGKYTSDPFISVTKQPGGGANGLTFPFQVSHAVSLVTDRRGPTGRGRFYLPLPLGSVDASGQITAALATGVATSVAQLVSAINDQPGVDSNDSRVVVASSKGYNSPVVAVRVGRVLDTVRSRRRSAVEGYPAEVAVTDAA